MDVHYDLKSSLLQLEHGICQQIPRCRLNHILNELRAIRGNSRPALAFADAILG